MNDVCNIRIDLQNMAKQGKSTVDWWMDGWMEIRIPKAKQGKVGSIRKNGVIGTPGRAMSLFSFLPLTVGEMGVTPGDTCPYMD